MERRPEDQRNSFIYQYRSRLKDKKVSVEEYQRIKANKRKDAYVFIRSCFESRKAGVIDEAEFFDVLRELIRSYEITKSDMNYILGEEADNSQKESASDKKKRLLISLDSSEGMAVESVTRIFECLCDKMIKEDISTFFYNIGYDSNMSNIDELQNRGKGRSRNDEALDMLFEYEKFRALKEKYGISPGNSKKNMAINNMDELRDDAFLRECRDLYNWLNQIEDFDGIDAFVPIIIDSESGLGIYIVGSSLLDPEKDYDKNCYYCCIRFEYGWYEEESFGEYCVKSDLSFEDFLDNYKSLNGCEPGDIGMLHKEYERGDYRFSIPFKVEGEHYKAIEGAIKEFCNLKEAARDLQGYDEVNGNLSNEIQQSNIADSRFQKYFVEPSQKLRREERKTTENDLYKRIREKARVCEEG